MLKDVPVFLLAMIVCAYWGTVAVLVLYKRLRYGRSAGVLPRHAYERRLWRLIAPVVAAWVLLPILTVNGRLPWLRLPPWAHDLPGVYGLRWTAAALAVVCYVLSLYCWLLLGRHWSMAIVPGQTLRLVTGGAYRWVRHPIYSLSVGLMLTSAVVVPTVPMALVAGLHVVAMNLKARYEERHLEESFGPPYAEYCCGIGRFWPRWSGLSRRST